MSLSTSLFSVVRRSVALAVVTGAGLAVAGAQTVSAPGSTGSAQPLSFNNRTLAPALGSTTDALFSSSLSSSSAADAAPEAANQNLASLEKNMNFPGANAQYGRRRYGAPRYRGGNTNADGSEKYTGYVGGGFAAPTGSNFNYATTSWGLQAGVGRNFNRRVGVNFEFDYDHFGMGSNTLNDQQNLYNYIIALYNANPGSGGAIAPITGLDGNNHIWSFSLDPTFTLHSGEGLGAYVIGGAGFYHKVANFTVPTTGEYCDPYYGCYTYAANQNIDHYFSNAPGLNVGVGFTYKFSRFANEKFFGEARVVHTFNSARPGLTYQTVTPGNALTTANDFPQNSNTTTWLPIKFGIRF